MQCPRAVLSDKTEGHAVHAGDEGDLKRARLNTYPSLQADELLRVITVFGTTPRDRHGNERAVPRATDADLLQLEALLDDMVANLPTMGEEEREWFEWLSTTGLIESVFLYDIVLEVRTGRRVRTLI